MDYGPTGGGWTRVVQPVSTPGREGHSGDIGKAVLCNANQGRGHDNSDGRRLTATEVGADEVVGRADVHDCTPPNLEQGHSHPGVRPF